MNPLHSESVVNGVLKNGCWYSVNRKPIATDVPPDIRSTVTEVLRLRGPRGAAKVLKISRPTVLAVAAGVGVHPGTLAVLRESTRNLVVDGAA